MQSKLRGRPAFTMTFGANYYLAPSLLRVLLALIPLAIVIFSAILSWKANEPHSHMPGWVVPASSVGLSIGGVFLGSIFAPAQKPQDYSHIAVAAVEDISEMNRATHDLSSRLNELITSRELAGAISAQGQLLLMQQELDRQGQAQIREIARWSQVAPGSEDEIVKGRQAAAAVLKKLEREQGND